jgi:transposase-like protein
MKCKRHSDGRKLDHVSLQAMRNQAVKAVRNGQTVQSVADAYGLNIRTVFVSFRQPCVSRDCRHTTM